MLPYNHLRELLSQSIRYIIDKQLNLHYKITYSIFIKREFFTVLSSFELSFSF